MLRAHTVALGLVALGCTNEPELPPELRDAVRTQSGGGTYAAGPYGTRPGDVVQNLCFPGWQDPSASGFDPAEFEEICFGDYYDRYASHRIKVLLVNTAAIWCTACRQEWCGTGSRKSLSEETALRFDRGFRAFGLLFEDAESNAAKPEHVVAWTSGCDVTIPFGLDADFLMGAYADKTVQPFNMVIDTSTMTIVKQINGDEPATLFAAIDPLLDPT